MVRTSHDLRTEVSKLTFGSPVVHVYNPLEYAWEPHRQYLSRFAKAPIEVLLVGMNPGPFGMAQTGVPFGDVGFVRDWMGIEAPVGHPAEEHPKRPILGFQCARSEVSGSRLWGWAKRRFSTADTFFERFFVTNYCPLVFLEETGRNRTPDKLPKTEQVNLQRACDRALRRVVEILSPSLVVGVGRFAEQRAREALPNGVPIGRVLHPSPASPKANRGWADEAEKELRAMGIALS